MNTPPSESSSPESAPAPAAPPNPAANSPVSPELSPQQAADQLAVDGLLREAQRDAAAAAARGDELEAQVRQTPFPDAASGARRGWAWATAAGLVGMLGAGSWWALEQRNANQLAERGQPPKYVDFNPGTGPVADQAAVAERIAPSPEPASSAWTSYPPLPEPEGSRSRGNAPVSRGSRASLEGVDTAFALADAPLAEADAVAAAPAVAQAQSESRSRASLTSGGEGARLTLRDSMQVDEIQGRSVQPAPPAPSTARFVAAQEQPWAAARDQPLSTFSVDVDTASWDHVRALLRAGQPVPPDAVRLEEFVNAFDYELPQPAEGQPFSVTTELSACPWAAEHQLLRVALQGREANFEELPAINLVFLVDSSGSMDQAAKLPLAVSSLRHLLGRLRPQDRVGIVTYAGDAGVVLEPTEVREREKIERGLDSLTAGGSTNGAGGIRVAYDLARRHFQADGATHVVLLTDGDFNVGLSGTEELVDLVRTEAREGVFLTVCGFGTDNLNDPMMEEISNHGNGVYFGIHAEADGRRVFGEDLLGSLVTLAKDVKIQLEFNPAVVGEYRLLGYDNRQLRDEDFDNDAVDAGEVGSGHRVTALYELIPPGVTRSAAPEPRGLRYQDSPAPVEPAPQPEPAPVAENRHPQELGLVALRWKEPTAGASERIDQVIPTGFSPNGPSRDQRLASAVAAFALSLRQSEFAGTASRELARQLLPEPTEGESAAVQELRELLGRTQGDEDHPQPQRDR